MYRGRIPDHCSISMVARAHNHLQPALAAIAGGPSVLQRIQGVITEVDG
jgi:hypothetical protein